MPRRYHAPRDRSTHGPRAAPASERVVVEVVDALTGLIAWHRPSLRDALLAALRREAADASRDLRAHARRQVSSLAARLDRLDYRLRRRAGR
jgi:hypothetical protein